MNKNDFAPAPPMGWNSYDYYDTTVNEEQVRANADYMAKNLKEFGWEYIIVDIQWYAHHTGSRREQFQYIPFSKLEMDEYSRLQPDPVRFPSSAGGAGFAPLAAYIHSLGLKFGIHIMRGIPRAAAHAHSKILGTDVAADEVADPSSICGWNPDMYGVRNTSAGQAYYDSILKLYASWGVDFIKCDDICNTNLYTEHPYSARHEIEMISTAITRLGRPIVLSLSPGPALIDKAWHYGRYANMWRITDDFWDDWDLLKNMFCRCELWQKHVSRGCYPDLDMLPLGRLGKGFGKERQTNFTCQEQRTMMTLWCLFGSPLMLGAELTLLDEWTLSLLTNKEILSLATPDCRPWQIHRDETQAIWTGCNETDGSFYVALFNLSDKEKEISVSLEELFFCPYVRNPNIKGQDVIQLRDLWKDEISMFTGSTISQSVKPHDCVIYKIG
ncbi:glycoside hydrolase family 27 protein [Blautia liquoris]|uniref:Alpha-galactosidase n=1 Tax=Blautia liquoris TaxID=2779518 RepID=A0A7M2RD77_9FIRM|nr:glycoside hydrolase family 27 protein [Blautia liquoris]QOV18098.1 glycoside hydrolase family 27 protein [Blautia liquoris]